MNPKRCAVLARVRTRIILGCVALAAMTSAIWLVGCSRNDPFDPDSAPNAKPVVRIFAAPLDPQDELAPTSYNERTFFWSGNDKDGWVTEYHVSIRIDRDVPAPWVVTDRTDTTMTFETDELGEAEATFYLVCRDNRGALSDTLTQLIPLRNFPPVINFQQDFEPLYDLQREISATNDTTFWNWGVNSFRFFAYDPDGSDTMDRFYRYTLSDTEPTVEMNEGEAGADPETMWIVREFPEPEADVHNFELHFGEIAPGERTLTLSLVDEAAADTRFQYTWTVREPKGEPGSRVLVIQEGAQVPLVFSAALDSLYGVDGWDTYRFWAQFPDRPATLIDTFRKFDLIIWGNSGGASPNLIDATDKVPALNNESILGRYVDIDNPDGGRLLMFSPQIVGYGSDLAPAFQQNVLGVNSVGANVVSLDIPSGKQAIGVEPHLGAMTSVTVYGGLNAVTLDPTSSDTEVIYRMEFCRGCYGSRNAPSEPDIGTRRPLRSTGLTARVVALSFTPENFFFYNEEHPELTDWSTAEALRGLLSEELGVNPE